MKIFSGNQKSNKKRCNFNFNGFQNLIIQSRKETKMWSIAHLFQIIAKLVKSDHVLDGFSVLVDRIELIYI